FNGDGGFQLNLQELQTIAHLRLDIAIIIMNNNGYGIIRQFQDSYLEGRHDASTGGYSAPDFGKLASAYGLAYARVTHIDQIDRELFDQGAVIIDVAIDPRALIEP